MSSRFIKIIFLNALLLNLSGHLVLGEDALQTYFIGKCVGRGNARYPTTRCRKYLQCGPRDQARIKPCNVGEIYNITSKTCVTNKTTPCKDTEKIMSYEWHPLDSEDQEDLKNGKRPPMPATRQDNFTTFDSIKPGANEKWGYSLKTRYLAVQDGNHTFTSKCLSMCKLWIRREPCGLKELVLDQKERIKEYDTLEYRTQKAYNMSFGHLYHLEAVYISSGAESEIQFGVIWPKHNKDRDKLPTVLLRFPRIVGNCKEELLITKTPPTYDQASSPIGTSPHSGTSALAGHVTLIGRPSPTGSLTSTGHPTPSGTATPALQSVTTTVSTAKLALTSSIRNQPTSSQQSSESSSSVIYRVTRTVHPPIASVSTTLSPEPGPAVENLADLVDEYLNNTTSNISTTNRIPNDGLLQARLVDIQGERIAKDWNQPGKSKTVWHDNVVMEVHYPLSNYTFPRKKIIDQAGKEFQSDQIFIPDHALVSNTGEFKRKVFSVLYLNLNEKIQRSFNVVATETNEIYGSYELNSHVIASTAVPTISGLPNYDVMIRLAHLRTNYSPEIRPICAFFKWSSQINSDGIWSTEGCIREDKLSSENVSVCRCNHLTHFGILMEVETQEFPPTHMKALRFITYIGCALSLVGSCLTVLAIICLPGARSDRNFIHVNLAVAIGLAQITFLAGIDETQYKVLCTIVAALLHYFLLVAFSWMLIEGIFLHILIVKVFHDHLPKKRFYVCFCWGLPFIVVLLTASLLRDGYGTKTSCWLSTDKLTIWTFSGPAILVITINTIILCRVMKEISALRETDQRDSNVRSIRYGVRSTIILLPLLGLTWAFGLICLNENLIVFQYLFAIFNSLQGLFIFLFHCVFNTEVRKAFWRKVDLWFTTHSNPFVNNAHSFKKSKEEPSSTFSHEKDKRTSQRVGFSMYSFNDLSERERRKLSTATASTCLDPWPHKSSLTPSLDNGGRFSPSQISDDIKYQPIHKQGDAGQKRIAPKIPGIKVEDLNRNIQTVDCDVNLKDESELIEKTNPDGLNLAREARKKPQITKPKEQTASSSLPNSGKSLETIKTNEANYVQKQLQHEYDNGSNDCESSSRNEPEKPRPTQRTSRGSTGDGVPVGIGGKPVNSADTNGHVRKIEVNSGVGKKTNISGRSSIREDLEGHIGTKL